MKRKTATIVTTLMASAGLLTAQDIKVQREANATAEAKAEVTADGESHMTRKTVTVTSDGEKTIRKTVTVVDGKEETVTEIIDGNGNVTRVGGGGDQEKPGNAPQEAAKESGAWLGVNVESASEALRDQLGLGKDEGVVVQLVAPDSPAAKVGIRPNDLLLSLDQAKLSSPEDLRAELHRRKAGDMVSLELLRKGQKVTESVTLGERKGDEPPAKDGKRKNPKNGEVEVEIQVDENGARAGAGGADHIEKMLNDPNIPEEMKKSLREMQERVRENSRKFDKLKDEQMKRLNERLEQQEKRLQQLQRDQKSERID